LLLLNEGAIEAEAEGQKVGRQGQSMAKPPGPAGWTEGRSVHPRQRAQGKGGRAITLRSCVCSWAGKEQTELWR